MRLNTINHLRVRRPNQNEQNPCVTVMSSMLSMYPSAQSIALYCCPSTSRPSTRDAVYFESHSSERLANNVVFQIDCWASAGYGAEGCAALEAQLRKCMDAPVRLELPYLVLDAFLTIHSHNAEIQGAEEEHRQLPPHENVPQGRWPAQEGRCPWLKCSLQHWIVRYYPSGLGSRSDSSTWSFGFLFDTILCEYSGLCQHLLAWSACFASEAMGVGFYSYVQYTTWDMESPVRTIDYTLISCSA